MSDRLDRVLRAIDSGLQSSGETGHTFDAGGCARCQRVMPVTDGGDLCPGCKAFLLGDGPEPVSAVAVSMLTQEDVDAAAAVFTDVAHRVGQAILDFGEMLAQAMAPLLDLFAAIEPGQASPPWIATPRRAAGRWLAKPHAPPPWRIHRVQHRR